MTRCWSSRYVIVHRRLQEYDECSSARGRYFLEYMQVRGNVAASSAQRPVFLKNRRVRGKFFGPSLHTMSTCPRAQAGAGTDFRFLHATLMRYRAHANARTHDRSIRITSLHHPPSSGVADAMTRFCSSLPQGRAICRNCHEQGDRVGPSRARDCERPSRVWNHHPHPSSTREQLRPVMAGVDVTFFGSCGLVCENDN
jgi:hypothetical protein